MTLAVSTRRPWLVACAAKRAPGCLAHAAAAELHRARHRDLAELLGEALDLSAQERQLAVDPDERHASDLLVAADRVQHDVSLVVLADRRIGEHALVVVAGRAPVGEHDAGRAVRRGLHAFGQERGDGVDRRGEVDGDDLARVVPGRRSDDRRAPGRRSAAASSLASVMCDLASSGWNST